jgi:deoxyadenosine/deoxycytidine kinase
MPGPHYIAIEGPIGVGKTSLAQLLAEPLNARVILERVEDNPFLSLFYKDQSRHALQTQLYFLLSRYQQQEEFHQPDLFNRITITDYLFAKDKIFAYQTLDDPELHLYNQIYAILAARTPQPDLVIFLQASTDVLLERIRRRARDYEREISPRYVEGINQAYNHYFFHYNDTPLLVIKTTEIDFVQSQADLDDLIRQIRQMKRGTQYYVPMGNR